MVPFRTCCLLIPVLLVGACSAGSQHSTQVLNERLQRQLAGNVAAGQATLQPLRDGAQVTLPAASTFASNGADLAASGQDTLANVVEGLLDPSLMRIALSQEPLNPPVLQDVEARTINQFFVHAALGPSLQPVAPSQGTPAPPGGMAPGTLIVTIAVACPDGPLPGGYAMGQRNPRCD